MQRGLKAAHPEKPEGHFPPGGFLASSADAAIANESFSEHLELQGWKEGVLGFPWGRKPSLAQDWDITEHQAGIPHPKILPGSLQEHSNSFADYFYLFPGSAVV